MTEDASVARPCTLNCLPPVNSGERLRQWQMIRKVMESAISQSYCCLPDMHADFRVKDFECLWGTTRCFFGKLVYLGVAHCCFAWKLALSNQGCMTCQCATLVVPTLTKKWKVRYVVALLKWYDCLFWIEPPSVWLLWGACISRLLCNTVAYNIYRKTFFSWSFSRMLCMERSELYPQIILMCHFPAPHYWNGHWAKSINKF